MLLRGWDKKRMSSCSPKVYWHGFLTFPPISTAATEDPLPGVRIQALRDTIRYSGPALPALLSQQKIISNRTSHTTSAEGMAFVRLKFAQHIGSCCPHLFAFPTPSSDFLLLYLFYSSGLVSVRDFLTLLCIFLYILWECTSMRPHLTGLKSYLIGSSLVP